MVAICLQDSNSRNLSGGLKSVLFKKMHAYPTGIEGYLLK